MADKKRMLYVQTSGIDRPERAYAPLVLATTAASKGASFLAMATRAPIESPMVSMA